MSSSLTSQCSSRGARRAPIFQSMHAIVGGEENVMGGV
jgi:hypothetical protein